MPGTKTRERRWIVLGDDGRHVTLGRHSDPTEDEIVRAAEALRATGMGGWLAVTEGVYYGRGIISVMEVRQLAPSPVLWQDAVRAFQQIRKQVLERPNPG